jgi:hypothetical protein
MLILKPLTSQASAAFSASKRLLQIIHVAEIFKSDDALARQLKRKIIDA